MGTRFNRLLADATRLEAKQWSSETASGWPAYCCPAAECGQIAEVDPTQITLTGVVLGRRACENEACGFTDYLEFESYGGCQ